MDKKKLESKKSMIILLIGSVVVVALGVFLFLGSASDVEVDSAVKADIYRTIEDTGKVRSERSLNLPALGNGRVLSINVESGDVVKAGDVLVSIDDSALRYQLESLEYQIKSLESNILYLADPYSDLSLENYRSSVKIAKENFEKAKSDYENAKTLFELGAISESELDSLELLSTVGEMTYIMAYNDSSAASKGGDDDIVQQYNFQLKSLIAQLESLNEQIDESRIKAPFDGTVSEIFVEEGEYVMSMSPVVNIYENQYYIEASLLEDSFMQIEMDAPVEINFGTGLIEGVVRKIYPEIKTVYSDLGVAQQKGIVEIDTVQDFEIMGREVELKFMLSRRQNVLTVDKDALLRFGRDDYLFIVQDKRAVLAEVSVGAKGNERCEILDGLQENDIVIINPSDELKDGDKVSY